MNEAAPVVTGRSDDKTAGIVFLDWRTDVDLQAQFNPYLELEEAKRIRDEVLHKFALQPGHVVGIQRKIVNIDAQLAIIRRLITERRWGRNLLDAYFGFEMPDEIWAKLLAEEISK